MSAVVVSEWVKLRSLRSTWWALGALAAVTVGVAAQVSSSLSFYGVPGVVSQDAMQDLGVYVVTVSTDFGALVVAVLGVLMIAGEYGTGTIRNSLTAVPTRLPVLGAKALVLACATFAVATAAFAVAVPISTGLLAGNDVDVHLDDPHYWFAVLGGVTYLVLVALIAFGIGALVRSTTGGIAISLGLLLAAPVALSLLFGVDPPAWAENLAVLLPTVAGKLLFTYPAAQRWVDLSAPSVDGAWVGEPWHGALVLVGWVAVLLAVAGLLLRRRDA